MKFKDQYSANLYFIRRRFFFSSILSIKKTVQNDYKLVLNTRVTFSYFGQFVLLIMTDETSYNKLQICNVYLFELVFKNSNIHSCISLMKC